MIYPKSFEKKIGFDTIRALLAGYCEGAPAVAIAHQFKPENNAKQIMAELEATEEFVQIITTDAYFPGSNFAFPDTILKQLKISGTVIEEEDFDKLRLHLKTLFAALRTLNSNKQTYPRLFLLSEPITLPEKVLERINHTIDEFGKVRSSASTELQQIRKDLIEKQNQLRRRIDKAFNQALEKGYCPDKLQPTIRSGRLVIPVLAEHKRQIPGFIHDESATGQTVFIEPSTAFDLNNAVRELYFAERREVYRILLQLTDYLRQFDKQLIAAGNFLAQVDFIRARARLALSMEATKPELINKPLADWYMARHPLLLLSFKEQNRQVVPFDLKLNQQDRILVISGPNAGGKSVTLKATGLLQYMVQCGLLVPVMPHSKFGVFYNFFIDMGDEQSLETDLSTYSSHLTHMRQIMELADKNSLLLIDEFGSGTEPNLGGAIAEAMLEKLLAHRPLGIITTHYANLKSMASKTPGLQNGNMQFDPTKMEALYQLETGAPGSSFAFEIAQRIGLPKDVLNAARTKLDPAQLKFDTLLRDLENQKREYSRLITELATRERQLKTTATEYRELKDFLEKNRKDTLNKAKQEARELLKKANATIEKTIKEIKEADAEKTTTQQARQNLKDFEKDLTPTPPSQPTHKPIHPPLPTQQPNQTQHTPTKTGPIEPGDVVEIKDAGAMGEVITIKGNQAEVLVGQLKTNVKLSRLQHTNAKAYKEKTQKGQQASTRQSSNLISRTAAFSPNIDIRGQRADEALRTIDQAIDSVLLAGTTRITIRHGRGDGILRRTIRQHLKKYPQVVNITDAHPDAGGDAVTEVDFH